MTRYCFSSVLLILFTVATTNFATGSASIESTNTATKVNVVVYLEALCIDSQKFLTRSLYPTFRSLGTDIMDLSVVPFGKTNVIEIENNDDSGNDDNSSSSSSTTTPSHQKKSPNGKYKLNCQHGDAECDANSWEQCVILTLSNAKDFLPILNCLFETLPMGYTDVPYNAALFQQCVAVGDYTERDRVTESSLTETYAATTTDDDAAAINDRFQDIKSCHHDNLMSWELQMLSQELTPSPLNHVPLIEINGDRFDETKRGADFKSAVCVEFVRNGGASPECDSFISTKR